MQSKQKLTFISQQMRERSLIETIEKVRRYKSDEV